jgi:PAS domain S-box-containing protein
MERRRYNRIPVVEIGSSSELAKEVEVKHILEEVKRTLQTIFDSIEDGIFVLNREHEIIRANKWILNMFGKRDFSGILGKKCFQEFYQRDEICYDCLAEKTFKEGISSQLTKISSEIGSKRVILNKSTFPIKDEDDNVIQVVSYIKDVTHVVKLEDQLLNSERLAGIGKLAAGVAHEVRNPLGNIKAAAQLCLDKCKSDKQIQRYLNVMLKNTKRINKVIKDLLNLAKPHDASFKIGRIDKIIDSLCDLANARCLKQRVRLSKRYPKTLPQILLDEKLLKEAFLNLIFNALDAMPNGGRLAINACYEHNDEEVVIAFCDSGCGISEDNVGRVFDPFFTTKKEGTGLGLSLARQIIEFHKGKIYIESKPDYGTEITVRLPVSKEMVSEDGPR